MTKRCDYHVVVDELALVVAHVDFGLRVDKAVQERVGGLVGVLPFLVAVVEVGERAEADVVESTQFLFIRDGLAEGVGDANQGLEFGAESEVLVVFVAVDGVKRSSEMRGQVSELNADITA